MISDYDTFVDDMPPCYMRWEGEQDVEVLLRRLSTKPHCLLLDSALRRPSQGRYSFLAADPFAWLGVPADGRDGLELLAHRLAPLRTATVDELPPFQGGAAGLFAYDLHRSLERIPATRYDEFQMPALAVGLYDVVLAIDHDQSAAWIISQGFPETRPAARQQRAKQRLQQFAEWLSQDGVRARATEPAQLPDVPREKLAPQFATGMLADLTSNFSHHDYLDAVRRTIEYIRAGDVFQVNLAQRLLYPARESPLALYQRLRQRNAATFAGYFDLGDFQILSASPERFVQLRGGVAEARRYR